MLSNRVVFRAIRVLLFAWIVSGTVVSQPPPSSVSSSSLPAAIRRILDRQEFTHSTFGIEFYSLDSGKVLFLFMAGLPSS